jgi:hypothetical protein
MVAATVVSRNGAERLTPQKYQPVSVSKWSTQLTSAAHAPSSFTSASTDRPSNQHGGELARDCEAAVSDLREWRGALELLVSVRPEPQGQIEGASRLIRAQHPNRELAPLLSNRVLASYRDETATVPTTPHGGVYVQGSDFPAIGIVLHIPRRCNAAESDNAAVHGGNEDGAGTGFYVYAPLASTRDCVRSLQDGMRQQIPVCGSPCIAVNNADLLRISRGRSAYGQRCHRRVELTDGAQLRNPSVARFPSVATWHCMRADTGAGTPAQLSPAVARCTLVKERRKLR